MDSDQEEKSNHFSYRHLLLRNREETVASLKQRVSLSQKSNALNASQGQYAAATAAKVLWSSSEDQKLMDILEDYSDPYPWDKIAKLFNKGLPHLMTPFALRARYRSKYE
jgi:hypothetical protein